jgi:DnaJ-domain-containing protein 1
MSPAEIAISVVGAAAGYWIVSKFIAGSAKPREAEKPQTASPARPVSGVLGPNDPVNLFNWHLVLGVGESASKEEISAAYKRKISQNHPDKVAQMGEEIRAVADAKSQQINAAYEIGIKGK